jgi:O-methyltransferase involved in polyketide biosynthesis
MKRNRAAAAKLGRTDLTESGNLLYAQERTEVVDWLGVNGWDVSAVTGPDLMARNGRVVPSDWTTPHRRASS